MSEVRMSDNEFSQLLKDYKEKYGAYPLSAPQLLSYATDIGKQLRYAFVSKSFQLWIDQNKEEYNSHTSGTEQTTKASGDKNGKKAEQEVCWDDIWADYVKTYSYPPKEPLHLWNHSKDMNYCVKYAEVRKLFGSLQKKHVAQQDDLQDENSGETMMKISKEKDKDKEKKTKKQGEVKKEELNDYVNEYVKKYKNDPKDARMLFHFCVEDMKLNVTYKAISKAFSLFFASSPNCQKRSLMAPVLTRHGVFVDYDQFVAKKVESPKSANAQEEGVSQIHANDIILTQVQTPQFSGDISREHGLENQENVQVVNKAQVQAQAKGEGEGKAVATPGANATNGNKEKMTEVMSEMFEEMWNRYKNVFGRTPQNARQMLTFATENGYKVTYAAIRRSWPTNFAQ